jgi:hypothetical protein
MAALQTDAHGFLTGEPAKGIESDKAMALWQDIRGDVSAIRQAVERSQSMSRIRSADAANSGAFSKRHGPAVMPERDSSGKFIKKTAEPKKKPDEPEKPEEPKVKAPATPRRKKPRKRDKNGRFLTKEEQDAFDRGDLDLNDLMGVKGNKSKDQKEPKEPKETKEKKEPRGPTDHNDLDRGLGIGGAVSDTAEGAMHAAEALDPAIAAGKEVHSVLSPIVTPFIGLGKRVLGIGRDKDVVPWYRRMWNELREMNKKMVDEGKGGGLLGFLAAIATGIIRLPARLARGTFGLVGSTLGLIPKTLGLIPKVFGMGKKGAGGLSNLLFGAGKMTKLGGMGRVLKGGGLLAALFGGAEIYSTEHDGTLTRAQKTRKNFGTGGEMAGSVIGGALGSFLGPLGTIAGAAVGGMAGKVIGEKMSEVNWRGVGDRMVDVWQSTADLAGKAWAAITKAAAPAVAVVTNAASKANEVVKNATGVDVGGTVGKVYNAGKGFIKRLLSAEGTTRVYERDDGTTETRKNGTRGWRNNNPGNMKLVYKGAVEDPQGKVHRTKEQALAQAKKAYGEGVIGLDDYGYAIFSTEQAGREAQEKYLKRKHKDHTIEQMLPSYAVSDHSGKADHSAYANGIYKVADAKGINLRGKKIGDMTPAEMAALQDGMKKVEGNKAGKVMIAGTPVGPKTGPDATVAAPKQAATKTVLAENLDTVSSNAPPVPSTNATPAAASVKIPSAPETSTPIASSGGNNSTTVIHTAQSPGQNMNDRAIAQIATGGMGSYMSNSV